MAIVIEDSVQIINLQLDRGAHKFYEQLLMQYHDQFISLYNPLCLAFPKAQEDKTLIVTLNLQLPYKLNDRFENTDKNY